MWITLYTDAGWAQFEKRARCAFYARSDWGTHTAKGEANIDGPTAAEGLAVLFALRWAVKTHPDLRGVWLRSDSEHLLKRLEKGLKHGCRSAPCESCLKGSKGDYRKVVQQILEIAKANNLQIDLKHVKAHGKEVSPRRRYLNDVVDRMSSMRGYSSSVKCPSSGSTSESSSSSS